MTTTGCPLDMAVIQLRRARRVMRLPPIALCGGLRGRMKHLDRVAPVWVGWSWPAPLNPIACLAGVQSRCFILKRFGLPLLMKFLFEFFV